MMMKMWSALLVLASLAVHGVDASEDDEHEEMHFEWIGVFELEREETYTWIASKVDEVYYENVTKLAIIELAAGDDESLHLVKELAEELLEVACDLQVEVGEAFFQNNKTCTTLVYDLELATSIFKLVAPSLSESASGLGTASSSFLAVFSLTSSPYLFEGSWHYLLSDHGDEVEPQFEEAHDDAGGGSSGSSGNGSARRRKAWRLSMLASFLVILCTGAGAVLRWFMVAWMPEILLSHTFGHCTSALAIGALLGCSFFLLFVEAVHLIGERWQNEAQGTWRFGVAVLAGYSACLVSSILVPHDYSHDHAASPDVGNVLVLKEDGKKANVADVEKTAAMSVGVPAPTRRPVDYALVLAICGGDFIHNVVDGILIAYAFLECKSGEGWVIVASTIYHELAQEISDFFLLINHAGLTPTAALLANLASGLSILVGVVMYMLTKPGPGPRGLMLAFGGGVYVYVAATEAARHVLSRPPGQAAASWRSKILVIFCYALGAAAIGVILIDHEHCESAHSSDEGGGSGGGHNHRRF
jgi:zinc transporter ZupT